ncbi:hypothetical protein E2C01_025990 [Portunus trituberculatus]|uniref:Uncharacterized protein n=1 Tax=Portunus trituberculatus TaxID=210409 RepID=A0A5B7EGZ7_PORTR|nr:hypothetical protein [Portunus trituberculatus]
MYEELVAANTAHSQDNANRISGKVLPHWSEEPRHLYGPATALVDNTDTERSLLASNIPVTPDRPLTSVFHR